MYFSLVSSSKYDRSLPLKRLVRRQIKIRAARNPFDLAPTHREKVFQIIVALGIVRRFFFLDIVGVRTFDVGAIGTNHFDANMLFTDI